MKITKRRDYIFGSIIALVIIVIVGLGSFLIGDMHALKTLSIKRATTVQLANAMQNDYFYSSYRESTILLTGNVSSVSQQGPNEIVKFISNSKYSVSCKFINTNNKFSNGKSITIISQGALADRQQKGVLLNNCLIPE